MHLLEADESAMDNTFETSANLTLYDVSGCQQKQVFQQQFESSFTCCDWNDEDYIAVGNENGEICLTTLDSMLQKQKLNLIKISDQSITFLSFSNESENLLAVGTSDGEFLLLKPTGQVIYKFQCKKLQGGETSITSLSWNIKVPRIIASSCQQIVQIHDTQKHTAIQTFITNKQILDIMFSQSGATNIYVLNDEQLQLWDLKDRKQAKMIIQHQLQDATYIKYIEGVEDVLGIFSESGKTVYVQCSTMKIIGQDQLGQIFSYAYPNMFASYIQDKLTLNLFCPIVFNQPVLFNSKLMYNLDLQDEDDLFDSQKLLNTIAISDTNVLYDLQQNQITKYQINDSDKLVQMAQQLINEQIKIEDEQVNKLINYLKLDNQQLINNIISQSQPLNQIQLNINETKQQINEKQEQQDNKQKPQLNDEDFFNNLDIDDDNQQNDNQEELEEIIEEVEEYVFEGQQYTDINDYLINGQFEDALNIVINQQKFDLLLELLNILPLSEEIINKYTDIYKQQTKQYQQVLLIAEQIADNQLQDLPCSWMQKISLAQKQGKDLISLAKQLLETQLDQEAKVPLLILINQQQKAINLVLNNKGEDLLQKLEIEIQLNKLNYSFYKSEIIQFIKMLKAGGNQELSEQLSKLVNIQITEQQIQSPQQKQQPKRKIHQQIQQQNQIQSPQFQPIDNFQLPPQPQQQISNQQMQNIQDPFMISSQPQQNMPQQSPFSQNIPQQNGLLNFNSMQNDAVNVVDLSGSNGSQRLSQTSNNDNFFIPQQPQIQQPQQLPPQVNQQANQMQQLPPQMQQTQQQTQNKVHVNHNRSQYHQQPQQNQIPQTQPQLFNPIEQVNQPLQPNNQFDQNPFQSPLSQQNYNTGIPNYNQQYNNMLPPTQIPGINQQPQLIQPQQQNQFPLPPSQQILQPQQQQQPQYQQQFTTTPRKMQIFAKPLQQLNPQLKSINLVNSVVLKTPIAQQVKQIAEKLYQKSQLEFQKNSKKIAELLIYLSDYKEVDNLMTNDAIEVIEQYVNQYNMGNIQQAKQLISDFSLQSGDLAQFAGILKIMAK